MIISPGRRYVFVHIPKTGGTSLATALEARAMADDILIGDTPKAERRRGRVKPLQERARGRLWKHSRLSDIEGAVQTDDFFVVTLVRNPWDRMVSYYHWLQAQTWTHEAVTAAKSMPFEAFVQDHGVMRAVSGAPYVSYVQDGGGQERCDCYVRLEHLAADLAPFEAHLGFALGKVPKLNASDRAPDYRGYYNEQTRKAVAQLCGSDIERFAYQF